MLLMKKHSIIELAGVTDALQQRSLYQCALAKNAPSWGIPSIYRVQNYVDRSFPRFLSVVLLDVTMVIVAEGTFKEKTRIKIPVSSISIIPQYSRSASNNTMIERKETSKMTAFIFLVDYCPIIKN